MKRAALNKIKKQSLQKKVKAQKALPRIKPNHNTFKNLSELKSKNENMGNFTEIYKKKWQEKKDARLFYENKIEEKITKKIIKTKEGTLEDFNKTLTSKVKRIKRRTLKMISIDKYQVLNCIKALKGFYFAENENIENEKVKYDFLYMKVTLNKQYEKVNMKNIQL